MQKKLWVACIAALFGIVVTLGQPALAQFGGSAAGPNFGQHRGMGQFKNMTDSLGLTAAQKAQLKPIMKSRMLQVQAVRSNTTLTPAQKQTRIEAIRKASRRQIMRVLTPAQRAKFMQMHRQHWNGMGGKPAG